MVTPTPTPSPPSSTSSTSTASPTSANPTPSIPTRTPNPNPNPTPIPEHPTSMITSHQPLQSRQQWVRRFSGPQGKRNDSSHIQVMNFNWQILMNLYHITKIRKTIATSIIRKSRMFFEVPWRKGRSILKTMRLKRSHLADNVWIILTLPNYYRGHILKVCVLMERSMLKNFMRESHRVKGVKSGK
jgi:hypothetical protein